MTTTPCLGCGAELEQKQTGRPRKWCGDECRRASSADRPPRLIGDVGEPLAPTVEAVVAKLNTSDGEPRALVSELLRQTAALVDIDPHNLALRRELRQILTLLVSLAGDEDGMHGRVAELVSRLGGAR